MGKKKRRRLEDRIRGDGGVVPVGVHGTALTPEQVAQKMAHLRSGAAGAHGNPEARRDRVGKGKRVGSRSARRRAAVSDWS